MAEIDRIRQYLPLVDSGQRIELYPPPKGLEMNQFELVDFNNTHLKVRNTLTQKIYPIPFALIEFISPTGDRGAVIRLHREMMVRGDVFL